MERKVTYGKMITMRRRIRIMIMKMIVKIILLKKEKLS